MRHLLLSMALLWAPCALCEPPTAGDIQLDIEEESVKPPQERAQDEAIAHFQSLVDGVKQGKAGSALMSERALLHLNAVYLLCAVNQGTCPLVLNGILESDILTSRVTGKVDCPNMKKFWHLWIQNDMEKHYQYMAKTAFVNEAAEFQRTQRPRYIRCSATVKEALDSQKAGDIANFIKGRYKGDDHPFAGTLRLLQQMKSRYPNIMSEIGGAKLQPKDD